MSLVDLYSVESKFDESKKEYVSIMDSLNYSCLGKEKSSKMCQRAAQLNAKMQSSLIHMSNLIVKNKPNEKINQFRLLKMADKLEEDLTNLTTNKNINTDITYIANMNHNHMFMWGLSSIVIISLVYNQYKKNISV
jgi:hypothetical protein